MWGVVRYGTVGTSDGMGWDGRARGGGHTDELWERRACRRGETAGMMSKEGWWIIWSRARQIVGMSGDSRC